MFKWLFRFRSSQIIELEQLGLNLYICHQIFWSENGHQVCIATEESFFILKFVPEALEIAKESKDKVTEDGIEDAFEVSTCVK